MLEDDWAPNHFARHVLTAVEAMLENPPDDGPNTEAAALFRKSPQEWAAAEQRRRPAALIDRLLLAIPDGHPDLPTEMEVNIQPLSGEAFVLPASPSHPVVALVWEASRRAGVRFDDAVLSFGAEPLPVKDDEEPWYDLHACGVDDGAVLTLCAEGGAHNVAELQEVVEAIERRSDIKAALDQDIERVASHEP